MSTEDSIVRSALWAAYGDAVGFIGEMADAEKVRYRTGGSSRIEGAQSWRRRIGGRFGGMVQLPAGCYSDDTQLRLATSRAIRANGEFDVEAFAKVELPVWVSYALGAGKTTRTAAKALAQPSPTWVTNFFDIEGVNYVRAGGNGAAMRIQPHVWSAKDWQRPETFLRDVVHNTIVTHGDPRGIVGAVIHALFLADTLAHREIPAPQRWEELVDAASAVIDLVDGDSHLRDIWRPLWEQKTTRNFATGIRETIAECINYCHLISELMTEDAEGSYVKAVERLGGFAPESRGSATVTALLASLLAWLYRAKPMEGILCAANVLGSDTDTIASMGGAIMGAVCEMAPIEAIADREYVEREARRLADVRRGTAQENFTYPDLLRWVAPRTQLDTVGQSTSGEIVIAGLGSAQAIGAPINSRASATEVIQWVELSFGQRLLMRQRRPLPVLPTADNKSAGQAPRQGDVLASGPLPEFGSPAKKPLSLDEASRQVIRSGFDPEMTGRFLLEFATGDNGIELAVGFAAIVSKAKIARDQAEHRRDRRKPNN